MDRVSAPGNQIISGGRRTWRNKNLGAGVAGTTQDQLWYAGVQESIIGAIEAAGLTPADSALGSVDTQLAQAIGILGRRVTGQCRLTVASASSLLLSPFDGNTLWINGASISIPSAGVAIANTALTAATLYYVYAWVNAGALALELSVTGYGVSSTDGTRVKTGDATRALVGMIYTGAGSPGTFVDTTVFRGLANYFNRRGRAIVGASTASATTASLTAVELNTAARVTSLFWADQDAELRVIGTASNNTAGDGFAAYVGFDGTAQGTSSPGYSAVGGNGSGTHSVYCASISEGAHVVSPFGASSIAGTATFSVVIHCLVRI